MAISQIEQNNTMYCTWMTKCKDVNNMTDGSGKYSELFIYVLSEAVLVLLLGLILIVIGRPLCVRL